MYCNIKHSWQSEFILTNNTHDVSHKILVKYMNINFVITFVGKGLQLLFTLPDIVLVQGDN